MSSNIHALRRQVSTGWTRQQYGLIAFPILMLAAALRLFAIDAHSYTNDEVFSIWLANHHPSYIIQYTTLGGQDATSPPLHYLLLNALLRIGDQPLIVRLPSVIAGVFIVWLTFRLALLLFDLRVAILSAFLVAVAPLHVALSQVARAHVLASLWALLSLYFFARLLFHERNAWNWIGLVAATVAALWTFPTTFLIVLFQNVCVVFLWLRRRLPRSTLHKWLASQFFVIILVLPAVLSILMAASGSISRWQTRPGLQELAKSAILFSTGDPSYGPTGITTARILSVIAIATLGALGMWLFIRLGHHRRPDEERRRVLFVLGAFMVPWVTIFAISQVRPIYQERYFLFAMPPLFILLAWILTRFRPVLISSVALLALLSLTGSALFIYYAEPTGEQWREAVAYMRPAYQSDDLVVISPGHYGRPFAYYFYGSFPPDLATLAYTPALVVENGQFRALSMPPEAEGARISEPALAMAQRVWLVSGYAPVDPAVLSWAEQYFDTLHTGEFVGARVRLLQRTQGQTTSMTDTQDR